MASNTRCKTCNGLLGPEDYVNGIKPARCSTCRERTAKAAAAPSLHPSAVAGRRKKALAMVAVIDANFVRQFPGLDVFDQAARIRLASLGWTDAQWEQIAVTAGFQPKAISDETRALAGTHADNIADKLAKGRGGVKGHSRRFRVFQGSVCVPLEFAPDPTSDAKAPVTQQVAS